MREGKRVSLVSIGVDAVSNAVLTIGNARLYLEENTLVRVRGRRAAHAHACACMRVCVYV